MILAFPNQAAYETKTNPVVVPDWVTAAGYAPCGFEIPRLDELFYDPARDKVIRCVEDIETRAFVLVRWRPA